MLAHLLAEVVFVASCLGKGGVVGGWLVVDERLDVRVVFFYGVSWS